MSFKINFFPKHFFIYIDGKNTLKWWWHENLVKVATSKIEIFCDTYRISVSWHGILSVDTKQSIINMHFYIFCKQVVKRDSEYPKWQCFVKKNVPSLYMDRTLFQVINIKFNFIISARPRIFCRYREQLIRFSSRELIFKRC